MTVECKGDITILVGDSSYRDEVVIWTIGKPLLGHIDEILKKLWHDQYAKFEENTKSILLSDVEI